jgi:hypothetical protein
MIQAFVAVLALAVCQGPPAAELTWRPVEKGSPYPFALFFPLKTGIAPPSGYMPPQGVRNSTLFSIIPRKGKPRSGIWRAHLD